jgi:hypothetical protein
LADQAFKEITAGLNEEIVREEIVRIVGMPPNAHALADKLTRRPDLQAQVASLTGYTPNRWILEHELTANLIRPSTLQLWLGHRQAAR